MCCDLSGSCVYDRGFFIVYVCCSMHFLLICFVLMSYEAVFPCLIPRFALGVGLLWLSAGAELSMSLLSSCCSFSCFVIIME